MIGSKAAVPVEGEAPRGRRLISANLFVYRVIHISLFCRYIKVESADSCPAPLEPKRRPAVAVQSAAITPRGIILRHNNVWRFGVLWLDTALAPRGAR